MSSTLQKVIKKSFLQSIRYFCCYTDKMDKKPILYGDEASPPVRFVLMTAAFLNIELDFHNIDLFKDENNSEFYKKINPLQKVPAMKVGDQVICDSHAIALYLCNRGATSLYPTDPITRARVDQMLFFNSSSLFQVDSRIFSEYFAGKWPVSEENVEKWNFHLNYLESLLTQHSWLAGDQMFLCDLSCAATITSCRLLVPSTDKHEKVNKWLERLEEFPCFDINLRGLKRLQMFVEQMRRTYK